MRHIQKEGGFTMNDVEKALNHWWEQMPRQMKARCWALAMVHGLVEDRVVKEGDEVKHG